MVDSPNFAVDLILQDWQCELQRVEMVRGSALGSRHHSASDSAANCEKLAHNWTDPKAPCSCMLHGPTRGHHIVSLGCINLNGAFG